MTKSNLLGAITLALFVLAAFAAGFGGMWFMGSLTANAWIAPSFAPPSWVFGPVWTTLYAMMGLSIYWLTTSPVSDWKPLAIALFILGLVLNTLWTPVFFGAADLYGALYIILGLLASIIAYIFVSYRVSKLASLLFVPYAAWVSFATILNISYIVINT